MMSGLDFNSDTQRIIGVYLKTSKLNYRIVHPENVFINHFCHDFDLDSNGFVLRRVFTWILKYPSEKESILIIKKIKSIAFN